VYAARGQIEVLGWKARELCACVRRWISLK
jgi:hypothetical protein